MSCGQDYISKNCNLGAQSLGNTAMEPNKKSSIKKYYRQGLIDTGLNVWKWLHAEDSALAISHVLAPAAFVEADGTQAKSW